MKLRQITLCFENCDRITVDGKYIGYFLVTDLCTEFRRIACNSIDKIDTANVFAVEIHKDANKERYQFGQEHIEDFKQMVFDRINEYKDITSIEFELEENYVEKGDSPCVEHYDYWVNWVGDSDYENEAQSNYMSKDGNLYIVIAAENGIEDFFDMEEINDSEYMNFHFDMCDVGDRCKKEGN